MGNQVRTITASNGVARLTLRSSDLMDHWLVYFDGLYLGESPKGRSSNRIAREMFAAWDENG